MQELSNRGWGMSRNNVDDCVDEQGMLFEQGCLFESLEPRVLLSGTSYVVNSLLDVVADDGVVTLREAIEASNLNAAVYDAVAGSASETDSIVFDASLYNGSIVLDGSELLISDDLDIQGLGADDLSVDGGGSSRVFYISGDRVQFKLSDITVTGGYSSEDGGGI